MPISVYVWRICLELYYMKYEKKLIVAMRLSGFNALTFYRTFPPLVTHTHKQNMSSGRYVMWFVWLEGWRTGLVSQGNVCTLSYCWLHFHYTFTYTWEREIAVGVHLIREIGVNLDTRHMMIDETDKFANMLHNIHWGLQLRKYSWSLVLQRLQIYNQRNPNLMKNHHYYSETIHKDRIKN